MSLPHTSLPIADPPNANSPSPRLVPQSATDLPQNRVATTTRVTSSRTTPSPAHSPGMVSSVKTSFPSNPQMGLIRVRSFLLPTSSSVVVTLLSWQTFPPVLRAWQALADLKSNFLPNLLTLLASIENSPFA